MNQREFDERVRLLKIDAKKFHDRAQKLGSADDYETAADCYDALGEYGKAERCRTAADKLRRVPANV